MSQLRPKKHPKKAKKAVAAFRFGILAFKGQKWIPRPQISLFHMFQFFFKGPKAKMALKCQNDQFHIIGKIEKSTYIIVTYPLTPFFLPFWIFI